MNKFSLMGKALLTFGLLLVLPASIWAEGNGNAVINYSVDSNSYSLSPALSGPVTVYNSMDEADDGSWQITWNFSAALDPATNMGFNGNIVFHNPSSVSKEFTFKVTVPSPGLISNALAGGILILKLSTSADGGSVTSPASGAPIAAMFVDGNQFQTNWYAPFIMSSTGMGTLTTNTSYGLPIPAMPIENIDNSMGMSFALKLTPGEKATVTVLSLFKGTFVPQATPTPEATPPSEGGSEGGQENGNNNEGGSNVEQPQNGGSEEGGNGGEGAGSNEGSENPEFQVSLQAQKTLVNKNYVDGTIDVDANGLPTSPYEVNLYAESKAFSCKVAKLSLVNDSNSQLHFRFQGKHIKKKLSFKIVKDSQVLDTSALSKLPFNFVGKLKKKNLAKCPVKLLDLD